MARSERMGASRARIASTAARLMAEDGVTDVVLAKKKAARQLGLSESAFLPDDGEVEAELRLYQALYQRDSQPLHLQKLRQEALRVMELLKGFHPYLTGAVLEGTAGRFSGIDLFLFADSAKEVEIFLLNQGMSFEAAEARHDKAEAVLMLHTDQAEFTLVIFAPQWERHAFRYRDGRSRGRIRTDALRQLLEHKAYAPCALG